MQWTIFEKLWKRTLDSHSENNSTIESTWNEEIEMLYRLGISMEDTLQFLYFKKPDFESFKNWILLNKNEKSVLVKNTTAVRPENIKSVINAACIIISPPVYNVAIAIIGKKIIASKIT